MKGNFELTKEQKIQFYTDGFIILKNVVDKQLLDLALRKVNNAIGKGISNEQMENIKKGKFHLPISSSPEITNCFNCSSVIPHIESLLGEGNVKQQHGGQIALRFPGDLTDEEFNPVPYWRDMWHIDGLPDENNMIEKGTIRNFTMLVGIPLTKLDEDLGGNLIVFPRSHFVIEEYFQQYGFEQAQTKGLSCLPYLPLSNGVQIKLDKGDVLLAHYNLAHSIAPNVSSQIRVNVRGEGFHSEPMLNIWKDYTGMKEIVEIMQNKVDLSFFKTEKGFKPFYVDAKAKLEKFEKNKKFDQIKSDLKKSSDLFFENHDFEAAAPLFDQLLEFQLDDLWLFVKACICHTYSKKPDLVVAEKYARKIVFKWKNSPSGYCLLGQILAIQAIDNFEEMLKCPVTEGASDGVRDSLKMAVEIIAKLKDEKSEEKLEQMFVVAIKKYPQITTDIQTLKSQVVLKKTWVEAWDWIRLGGFGSERFERGRKIFEKILNIKIDDYWALFFMGGCWLWDGKYEISESYFRQAISVDPNVPHCYSCLAQALQHQKKTNEAVEIVSKMFLENSPFFDKVETDNDHKSKLVEALKVVRDLLGQTSQVYQTILSNAIKRYPSAKQTLETF